MPDSYWWGFQERKQGISTSGWVVTLSTQLETQKCLPIRWAGSLGRYHHTAMSERILFWIQTFVWAPTICRATHAQWGWFPLPQMKIHSCRVKKYYFSVLWLSEAQPYSAIAYSLVFNLSNQGELKLNFSLEEPQWTKGWETLGWTVMAQWVLSQSWSLTVQSLPFWRWRHTLGHIQD